MAGGIVEGQRGERIHHPKAAGVAAINGFNANDADDDFGRYAVFGFGTRQRSAVGLPEIHTGPNADRVNKAAAVNTPVLDESLRGRLHQPRHGGVEARLANGLPHPLRVQIEPAGQVVGKLHRIRARGVERPLRLFGAG